MNDYENKYITVEKSRSYKNFVMHCLSLKGFMIVTVCTAVALGREHNTRYLCKAFWVGCPVLWITMYEE